MLVIPKMRRICGSIVILKRRFFKITKIFWEVTLFWRPERAGARRGFLTWKFWAWTKVPNSTWTTSALFWSVIFILRGIDSESRSMRTFPMFHYPNGRFWRPKNQPKSRFYWGLEQGIQGILKNSFKLIQFFQMSSVQNTGIVTTGGNAKRRTRY